MPARTPTAAARTTPAAVVAALCESLAASLGDLPKGRDIGRAASILVRQVEALAALDPGYPKALRDYVVGRVRPLVPDDEAVDKVLTDPNDPIHAYWMAVLPKTGLRHQVARRVQGGGMEGGLPFPFPFPVPDGAVFGEFRVARARRKPDDDAEIPREPGTEDLAADADAD